MVHSGSNVSRILTAEKTDKAIEAIWKLETLENIGELMKEVSS